MLTEKLVDTLVVTADVQSASKTFHMPKTVRGIVQYTTTAFSGLTNVVFKLQGKLSADHDWVDVTDTSKTHTGNASTATEDITLYPIMRCHMNVTGTGTVTCLVHVGA